MKLSQTAQGIVQTSDRITLLSLTYVDAHPRAANVMAMLQSEVEPKAK